MKGKYNLTPEGRAKLAQCMREKLATPGFVKNKSKAWTPERRAKQSAIMAERNKDPELTRKRTAWQRTPEGRECLRQRGAKLIVRLKSEPALEEKRLANLTIYNTSPRKRAIASETMKRTRQRPDVAEKLAAHARSVQRDPVIRARIAETRRLGTVPKGFTKRYRSLRHQVGAKVAFGIVQREAQVARQVRLAESRRGG